MFAAANIHITDYMTDCDITTGVFCADTLFFVEAGDGIGGIFV